MYGLLHAPIIINILRCPSFSVWTGACAQSDFTPCPVAQPRILGMQ